MNKYHLGDFAPKKHVDILQPWLNHDNESTSETYPNGTTSTTPRVGAPRCVCVCLCVCEIKKNKNSTDGTLIIKDINCIRKRKWWKNITSATTVYPNIWSWNAGHDSCLVGFLRGGCSRGGVTGEP